MENLKQRFKARGLRNKDVAQAIREEWNCKFNPAAMSYIVNGLTLPTAPAWRVIAQLIDEDDVTAVFPLEDIDLFGFYAALAGGKISPAESKEKRDSQMYDKITVRLPKGTKRRLNLIIGSGKEYLTQAHFILAALDEALKRKAVRTPGAEADGKQVNECAHTLFTSTITQEKEVCQDE